MSLEEMARAIAVLREAAAGAYRLHPDVRNALRIIDAGKLYEPIDDELWYEPVTSPAE